MELWADPGSSNWTMAVPLERPLLSAKTSTLDTRPATLKMSFSFCQPTLYSNWAEGVGSGADFTSSIPRHTPPTRKCKRVPAVHVLEDVRTPHTRTHTYSHLTQRQCRRVKLSVVVFSCACSPACTQKTLPQCPALGDKPNTPDHHISAMHVLPTYHYALDTEPTVPLHSYVCDYTLVY